MVLARHMADVRIAVLTLTRDRLEYTQHCFDSLRENAGCAFDHYVLDQGSEDGTREWLTSERLVGRIRHVVYAGENIGCCRGWNRLLDGCHPADYDAVVTFDNDCEVLTYDALAVVAELAVDHQFILSPQVHGLMYPPATIANLQLGRYTVDEKAIIGNIFMAIPATLFSVERFRWDERYAVWDGGESITQWYRQRGGRCGYVQGFGVNHYKTTLGQVEDMPWYFERRVLEGGRAQ